MILIKNNSAINTIKWMALILMTLDHTNKYLFNTTLPFLYEAGRLALPLFIFALSFNLSRPTTNSDTYKRVIWRTALVGVVATPPFLLLGSTIENIWPLNIMFTLSLIALVIWLIDSGETSYYYMAGVMFIAGGALVEYWWPALALGVSTWLYCKKETLLTGIAVLAACASLALINNNFWALCSIPIIYLVIRVNLNMNTPRLKWFFYAFYPFHLAIFFLIRIPLSKAGYLFF